MKTSFCLFLLFAFALFSCNKNNSAPPVKVNVVGEDNGCITREWKHNNFGPILEKDLLDATAILEQSGIDHSNLEIYFVSKDGSGPSKIRYINARQKVNGIELLSSDITFQVTNEHAELINGGGGIPQISTTLDTLPSLTLGQVRSLFLRQLVIHQDGDRVIDFDDSCVSAQFGYYDVNTTQPDRPANLVKAWFVNVKYLSGPRAYFKDDGTLIVYIGSTVIF